MKTKEFMVNNYLLVKMRLNNTPFLKFHVRLYQKKWFLIILLMLVGFSVCWAQSSFITGNTVLPPSRRFIINDCSTTRLNDDIVHDKKTGLMWKRDPKNQYWQGSSSYLDRLNSNKNLNCGYSDWRMPRAIEIASMLDYSLAWPFLPKNHPFEFGLNVGPEGNGLLWLLLSDSKSIQFLESSRQAIISYSEDDRKNSMLSVWPVRNVGKLLGPCDGAQRFKLKNSGTVYDSCTGLMWMKEPRMNIGVDKTCAKDCKHGTWEEAKTEIQAINSRDSHGYSDWKIPNLEQLYSLVDRSWIEPPFRVGPFNALEIFDATQTFWIDSSPTENFQKVESRWVSSLSFGLTWPAPGLDGGKANLFPVRVAKSVPLQAPALVAPNSVPSQAEITLSNSSISIPITFIGANNVKQSITVTNNVSAPLVINDMRIEGPDANHFKLQGFSAGGGGVTVLCPTQYATGTTCPYPIEFKPTETGILNAELVIDSNAIGSPHRIPIQGLGVHVGITVITHGFNGAPNLCPKGVPKWTFSLADAIAARVSNATIYLVQNGEVKVHKSRKSGNVEEKIVVFNWSNESCRLQDGYAEAAGDALFSALAHHASTGPNKYWDLQYLHFIGHSRGAVVNSEAIQRLLYALDNDLIVGQKPRAASFELHVTTLDPHPWADPTHPTWDDYVPGDAGDNDLNGSTIGLGVIGWRSKRFSTTYSDNYYQHNGSTCRAHPTGIENFMGLNYSLPLTNYPADVPTTYKASCIFVSSNSMNHSAIHAWYHGTVNHNAKTDGAGSSISKYARQWYTYHLNSSNKHGFDNSRLAGNLKKLTSHLQVPITNDPTFVDSGSYLRKNWLFNGDFSKHGLSGNHWQPGWEQQGGSGSGNIDNDHLELNFLDGSITHNWFYIPAGTNRLQFKYRIVNNDVKGRLNPSNDRFVVRLETAVHGHIEIFAKQVNKETASYVFKNISLDKYSGMNGRLTFEIEDKGWFSKINSEVWVDDVRIVSQNNKTGPASNRVASILNSPIPIPFLSDQGACPFEGCVYGEWTATKAVNIYKDRNTSSAILFSVSRGEKVQALTGVVDTYPGIMELINNYRDPYQFKKEILAGTILYIYTYLGENCYKTYYKNAFVSLCLPASQSDYKIVRKPRETWWVKVLRNGKVGWSNEADKFTGKDAKS